MEMNRRDFLKTIGIASLTALAIKEGSASSLLIPKAYASETKGVATFVPTICGMCPNCCSVVARVRNGRVDRIFGNPYGYTYNLGSVCSRGEMGIYRLYNPDRLKYPMVRAGGKRGEWNFKRVSWEKVVKLMAKHLREKLERGEGAKIAAIGGWLAWDFYAPFTLATLFTLGSTNFTIVPMTGCLLPKTLGWTLTIGAGAHFQFMTDYDNVKYLIVLKRNIGGSIGVPHASRFGRNLGKMKLVVLDPRLSETATKAHEWIPIRPGTDLAFLLAMANVIVSEGLYDEEYLAKYTNAPMLLKDGEPYSVFPDPSRGSRFEYLVWDLYKGKAVPHKEASMPALEGEFEAEDGSKLTTAFSALKESVKDYTPEWAEEITDVPADKIREIAREFATIRPSAIDTGWHDPKHVNSPLIWRVAGVLNALVGSIGTKGGILFSGSGVEASRNVWWKGFLKPESDALSQWMKSKGIIVYPFGWAYQAFYDLLTGKFDYKVGGKSVPGKWTLIILGANPMRTQMEAEKWKEAFSSDNVDAIVDIDILPSDTTAYADIILPDCTYLERDEHIHEIEYVPVSGFYTRFKAVEPLYDCLSFEVMAVELMKAIGKEYYLKFFKILGSLLKTDPEALRRGYEREGIVGIQKAQALSYGISYSELRKKGYILVKGEEEVRKENLELLKEGMLATPSGRIEIYSFLLKKFGQNPLVFWMPPKVYGKADPEKGVFYLVYGKVPSMTHSSTADNPLLSKRLTRKNYFRIWMNRQVAEKMGISDGDLVTIESLGTGKALKTEVHVTDRIRPDTVYVPPAFGQRSELLEFRPSKGIALNELVPLQWGPIVGGALSEEVLVKVKR